MTARSTMIFALLLTMAQAQTVLQPADGPARLRAGQAIEAQLLVDSISVAVPAMRLQLLSAGLETAGASLTEGTRAKHNLTALLTANPPAALEPEAVRQSLRMAAFELADDLLFSPVQEAQMPAGFPGFLAIDEVELRTYPAYRMVKTNMQGGQMGAFWPLFRHIEEHGIAMTTPVQTDWQEAVEGKGERAASMAFLYGDKALGKLGQDGKVEVVDVAGLTVLSIGARGGDTTNKVKALRLVLLACLQEHPEWAAAGPVRTMGYNSPSVMGDRRYFEVQLPVRIVEKKKLSQ